LKNNGAGFSPRDGLRLIALKQRVIFRSLLKLPDVEIVARALTRGCQKTG